MGPWISYSWSFFIPSIYLSIVKSFIMDKNRIRSIVWETVRGMLNERVSSVVFHFCSYASCLGICEGNRFVLTHIMRGTADGDISKKRHYLSTTRQKSGLVGYSRYKDVRITLDGDKLNEKYMGNAVDYWGDSMGKQFHMRQGAETGHYDPYQSTTESEDRIFSDEPVIPHADRYIKRIDILLEKNRNGEYTNWEVKAVQDILKTGFERLVFVYGNKKDFDMQNGNVINDAVRGMSTTATETYDSSSYMVKTGVMDLLNIIFSYGCERNEMWDMAVAAMKKFGIYRHLLQEYGPEVVNYIRECLPRKSWNVDDMLANTQNMIDSLRNYDKTLYIRCMRMFNTFLDKNDIFGLRELKKFKEEQAYQKYLQSYVVREGKEPINEITTVDAWNKFYKEKLPEELYKAVMNGTNNMTAYHKTALDLAINGMDRDIDKEDIPKLCARIGELWRQSSPDARKSMLDSAKESWTDYSLYNYLFRMSTISGRRFHTEKQACDAGLVTLYDGPRLLMTCTTSYAASKKHYGYTRWCTASDVFGRFNGFKMFQEYVEDDECVLIQLVDKSNPKEHSYQVAVSEDGAIEIICDVYDEQTDEEFLNEFIEEIDEHYTFYDLTDELNVDFAALLGQSMANINDEQYYWYKKIDQRIAKVKQDISKDYYAGKYEDMINNTLEEQMEVSRQWGGSSPTLTFIDGRYPYAIFATALKPLNDADAEWIEREGDDREEVFVPYITCILEQQGKDFVIKQKLFGYYPSPICSAVLITNDKDGFIIDLSDGRILCENCTFFNTVGDIKIIRDSGFWAVALKDANYARDGKDGFYGGNGEATILFCTAKKSYVVAKNATWRPNAFREVGGWRGQDGVFHPFNVRPNLQTTSDKM